MFWTFNKNNHYSLLDRYVDADNPHLVCKLLKGLYGIKQGGRLWHAVIHGFLLEIGFSQSMADSCIYLRRSADGTVIIGLYVDDHVIAGSLAAVLAVKAELCARFDIKDLGPANYVLGWQVKQDTSGVMLNQATYISTMDLVLAYANVVRLPMSRGDVQGISPDNIEPTHPISYCNIVGKLMYAMVGTRPNIAFAVGVLGRFASNPGKIHLKMAQRTVVYLKMNLATWARQPGGRPAGQDSRITLT